MHDTCIAEDGSAGGTSVLHTLPTTTDCGDGKDTPVPTTVRYLCTFNLEMHMYLVGLDTSCLS